MGRHSRLGPRPGRESHHGIVLDPAQGELADAAVHREASQLRLGRVRRKDLYLPAAQVVGAVTTDQPAQLQPDFHVLCRRMVIVVEQVKNESPTVGLPRQMAQHVTARLQAEARPSGRGFGARRNSRLPLSGPDNDTSAGGKRIQPGLLLGAELGQVSRHHQHLEPVQGNSLIQVREHFGLEEDALLEEFVGQRVPRLRGDQGDPRRRLCLVIQLPMLDQEMVVLSDGRPGLPGLRLAVDQR